MESPMKESGENDIPEFEEIFEPLKFYLKSICIPILFPGSTENELFEKAFESESTLESLNKFSRSTEYSTLMIEALPDRGKTNYSSK